MYMLHKKCMSTLLILTIDMHVTMRYDIGTASETTTAHRAGGEHHEDVQHLP